MAGHRGRWGTARWGDVLLPAGLFVAALLMLFVLPDEQAHRPPDLLAILLLAAMLIALTRRRRWPIPVLAINILAMAPYQLLDYPPEPALPPVLVALYTVASTGEPRRSLVIGVLTSVLVVATFVVAEPEVYLSEVLGAIGWVSVALASGEAVSYHRAYTAEVEARVARAEAVREDAARQRVAQERIRIARDVHDVVAHSIAAINVQAGVAAHLIAESDQPDSQTLSAIGGILRSIAETSRTGVTDLNATLELLRGDEAQENAPVSGLAGVPALVEPLRATGTEVTVDTVGRRRVVPRSHDVAAFRIIQEALTNAVKHGRAERIEVTVHYDRDALRLTVADHGPGPTWTIPSAAASGGSAVPATADTSVASTGPGGGTGGPPAGGTAGAPGAGQSGRPGGYGIVGMTERAHSVGGRLDAGARPDGGFAVHAVLPLPAESPGVSPGELSGARPGTSSGTPPDAPPDNPADAPPAASPTRSGVADDRRAAR